MEFLLSHYKRQDHEVFSALYLQTERNTKVGAVFGDMGFAEIENSNSERKFVFNFNDAIQSDGVIDIHWNEKKWSI
jgi:predicted enzyme involved in methoxymalonyl-ACP biosynthesis